MYRFAESHFRALTMLLAATGVALAEDDTSQVDPSGTWKWERTFGDVTIDYTLRLQWKDETLSGTYATRWEGAEPRLTEPAQIDEAKREGTKISFQVTREFNGQQFVVHYQGTASEDEIKGSAEVDLNGNPREFDWHAKRVLDVADVIGTWLLRIETPNRTIEPTLRLEKDGEKLKGAYVSTVFGEHAVKELLLKDGQLSFQVTFERDGNEFTVAYKGKPRGESMSGTIHFEFGGEARETEFRGKRQPARP